MMEELDEQRPMRGLDEYWAMVVAAVGGYSARFSWAG
jgi:hypothetical protein